MFIVIIVLVVWMLIAPNPYIVSAAVTTGFILLSAGIFPLTHLVYNETRLPVQLKRISEDFQLLNLEPYIQAEETADRTDVNAENKTEIHDDDYSLLQFIIFSTLIMLLVVSMDIVLLVYIDSPLLDQTIPLFDLPKEISNQIGLIISAFLGAYLFAIQELIRRYNTSDLQPQVYGSIFVRMVVAIGIMAVAAAVLGNTASKNQLAVVVAFLIGTFPQRGMDWLRDKAKDIFDTRQKESTIRPLTNIIGINPWHEARLRELGIDDAQNLATVDIRRLLFNTVFDTGELVHWIDQAILYVKVGDQIENLRLKKITTFSEFLAARGMSPLVKTNTEQAPNVNETATDNLLRDLNFKDLNELARVDDFHCYPNVIHVFEYYQRSRLPAHERRTDETIENWIARKKTPESGRPPQPAAVSHNGTQENCSTESPKVG